MYIIKTFFADKVFFITIKRHVAIFSLCLFASYIGTGCIATRKDIEQLTAKVEGAEQNIVEKNAGTKKDLTEGIKSTQDGVQTVSKKVDETINEVKNAQDGVRTVSEKIDKTNEKIQESLSKNIAKTSEELKQTREGLKNDYQAFTGMVDSGLEKISKNSSEHIESAYKTAMQVKFDIKTNFKYAEEAEQLSNSAMQKKDFGLAKIYMLNAINHMPHNFSYIEAYNDLITKKTIATFDELKHFSDILDVAVYQISPSDVARIIELREITHKRMEEIEKAEQEKELKEYRQKFEEANQKIGDEGELAWNKIITSEGNYNQVLLLERINIEKMILEDGVSTLGEEVVQEYKDDLNKAGRAYQMVSALVLAEKAIEKAEAIVKKKQSDSLVSAQNQLQTAASFLTQVWTENCEGLDDLLVRAKKNQERIGKTDTELKRLASLKPYKKIQSLFASIAQTYNSYPSYTNRINAITKKISEIQTLLVQVSYPDFQLDVANGLKDAMGKIHDLKESRYVAYQKWALEKLTVCNKYYNNCTAYVSDDEGDYMFNNYLLEINPSLLSYDLQVLYNSIYENVIKKVSDKAQSQIKKAGHKCRSLEDY